MMNTDEFYDLAYDVYMSGGNPDAVGMDEFDRRYDGEYDWVNDTVKLENELRRQRSIGEQEQFDE